MKAGISGKQRMRRLIGLFVTGTFMLIYLSACGTNGEENKSNAATDGYAKLQALRVHEDSLLTQYKLTDKEKGVYRIPVERALELVAAENTGNKE